MTGSKATARMEPKGSANLSVRSRDRVIAFDTTPQTPLRDVTNESTPQKVDSKQPTPIANKSNLNNAPTSATKASPATNSPLKSALKNPLKSHEDIQALPPISDPGGLVTPKPKEQHPRFASVGQARWDRVEDVPELPKGWTPKHDRSICYLDFRGCELREIVMRIRTFYPELDGPLHPDRIDARLRQLDQDIEVTHWRDAIRDFDDARKVADFDSLLLTPIIETPTTAEAEAQVFRGADPTGAAAFAQSEVDARLSGSSMQTKPGGRDEQKRTEAE